jgi:adenylate cyclase
MGEDAGTPRLAAVMSIDIAGFSAMTEVDEAEAAQMVSRIRAVVEAAATQNGGRIFNTAGDSFMLEFPSAAGALAAADVLWGSVERKGVRVGVHVGDVLPRRGGDLIGHCVNVAARLQQLADPGTIVVSMDARRAVRGKLTQRLHAAGGVQLDKMNEAIEIFTFEPIPASKQRTRKSEPILAVLPFDNESNDEEMDFFSDGVADEIIRTLMKQSTIRVIGRTSAFKFRGDLKTEAAAALRASHVLDGAVHKNGVRLRVGVNLTDAKSGIGVWGEKYDGDVTDAFSLQDNIAANVATALRRSLTQPARPAPINPAAYELYLRARQIWLMLSDVEEDQAETLLQRCVSLAPDFADGWAALASVRAFLLPRDRDIVGSAQHDAAMAAAHRALQIDPNCAQALAALSLLKPAFAEHGEKLRLVNEALKHTPNDGSLHVARAAWLYSVGRLKDAGKALETASMLDPLGPAVEGLRASLLIARGETEMAVDIMNAAWSRWPDSPFIWYLTWTSLCAARRLDEAEAMAAPGAPPRRAVSAEDVQVLRDAVALLRTKRDERRARIAAGLDALAKADGPVSISSCIAGVSVGCGELVFDLLDDALDRGRPLRADPFVEFGMARAQTPLQLFVGAGDNRIWKNIRFPALCARLGLAQYWVETKKWPDCASDVDYDFKAECAKAVEARRSG